MESRWSRASRAEDECFTGMKHFPSWIPKPDPSSSERWFARMTGFCFSLTTSRSGLRRDGRLVLRQCEVGPAYGRLLGLRCEFRAGSGLKTYAADGAERCRRETYSTALLSSALEIMARMDSSPKSA